MSRQKTNKEKQTRQANPGGHRRSRRAKADGNQPPRATKTDSRSRILEIARSLLRGGGPEAVTFDAIAARLGHSRQAVLYWFPKKQHLIAEMFLPYLGEEADAAGRALAGAANPDAAVEAFIRGLAAFHLADLDRFRLVYLVPQSGNRKPGFHFEGISERVHPITDRLYAALSAAIKGELSEPEARRRAVALHMSVLGMVLMVSLAEALDDPLKHGTDALITALIDSNLRSPGTRA